MNKLVSYFFIIIFLTNTEANVEVISWQDGIAFDHPEKSNVVFNPLVKKPKLITHTKNLNGKEVFKYKATLDQYGFRIIESENVSIENTEKHIIFAGCSFVFGEGLKDEDTFIHKIINKLKKYEIRNLGIRGGSVLTQLHHWRVYDMSKQIENESGYMIYILFDDHRSRSVRDWKNLAWEIENSPNYEKSNDDVIIKGSVGSTLPYEWLRLLSNIGLRDLWMKLVSHFKRFRDESDLNLLIHHLKVLEREYTSKFPKGKFIVSELFPFPFAYDAKIREKFMEKMREANIQYWPMQSYKNEKSVEQIESKKFPGTRYSIFNIEGDGHPSSYANDRYADFLIKNILNLDK